MKRWYWCAEAFGGREYSKAYKGREQCLKSLQKYNSRDGLTVEEVMHSEFYLMSVTNSGIVEELVSQDEAWPEDIEFDVDSPPDEVIEPEPEPAPTPEVASLPFGNTHIGFKIFFANEGL